MLSFSSPWWLLALLVLPLVWWLHRFAEHDREHPVAALFLWTASAQAGTARRVAQRAEPLWIPRALAVALLVLALSGLKWSGENNARVTIWIDSSPSMYALEQGTARLQRSLKVLAGELADSNYSAVELRSLAHPGQVLALPEVTTTSSSMEDWATSWPGEPRLPEPSALDATVSHWLVSDGVSDGIAPWAQLAPISRVIGVGSSGDNAGITALSLRPGAAGGEGAQLLITIANGSDKTAVRDLVIAAGDQRLATLPLRLPPRGTVQEIIELEVAPSTALSARIHPADALPLDDYLALSASELRPVPVYLNGECGRHLRAALLAHPRLAVPDDLQGPAGIAVYCGVDGYPTEGPALKFYNGSGFNAIEGDIVWHPAGGRLRELSLDPKALSRLQRDVIPSGAAVLLSAEQQPLILFDAQQQIIDIRLDMAAPGFTSRPEYPLLVSGLVALLLGDDSGMADIMARYNTSPVSILPREIVLSRPPNAGPVVALSQALSGHLLTAVVVLLLLDIMLLLWRQTNHYRKVFAGVPGR